MTATAFKSLRARVLSAIAANDLDASFDRAGARRLIEAETEQFQRELMRDAIEGLVPFSDPDAVVERLLSEVEGVGSQLAHLLCDPRVEEVYGVDGDLTFRFSGGSTSMESTPGQPDAMLSVVQRMVAGAGESLDAAHPKVDGIRVTLPDGRRARLSAAIPPRIDGTVSFSLRVPQKRHTTLDDLVDYGSITAGAAAFLGTCMRVRRTRVLVAGPPGAGKTTLIEALLRSVPPGRRVICAEEQRELSAPLLNGEYWQTSKVETLTDLIRSARVASPELIVLGELKGPEAWELLMAGTLGIGVVAAVHAEDSAGAFEALAICATKSVPATPFTELQARFGAMFDIVVYCDINESETEAIRRVTQISVVPPQVATASGGVAVTPVFSRDDIDQRLELRTTAVGSRLERRCGRLLSPYGLSLPDVLKGATVPW